MMMVEQRKTPERPKAKAKAKEAFEEPPVAKKPCPPTPTRLKRPARLSNSFHHSNPFSSLSASLPVSIVCTALHCTALLCTAALFALITADGWIVPLRWLVSQLTIDQKLVEVRFHFVNSLHHSTILISPTRAALSDSVPLCEFCLQCVLRACMTQRF
jgi:hypothetical protein